MADHEIPAKIDLRYVASENPQLFRELCGILNRLNFEALSEEEIEARFAELLDIAKSVTLNKSGL